MAKQQFLIIGKHLNNEKISQWDIKGVGGLEKKHTIISGH